MTELRVETRAEGEPPSFGGPTGDLVYFLSFAVAERYGATHELSGVARILRARSATPAHPEPVEGRVSADALRPLLTFAEDNPADTDDRRDMEQIWQPAGPVAAAAAWATGQIRASQRLLDLTAGFPDLLPRLDDLARIATWSAEREAAIRLLFSL
ncbi:MAG TPA: hypothetical protein VK821_09615 [Dehalococcoidia bacterium]|nr:hypothetical protein [Dehalococcoidia bacterium]